MKDIPRKIAHLIAGVVFSLLIFFKIIGIEFLIGLFFLVIILTFLSLRKIKFLERFLDVFERHKDRRRFVGKGVFYYVAGMILSVLWFPSDVAAAAIMILGVGDSLPYFVSLKWGRMKHPFSDRKYLEGAIVGVFGAFLACLVYVVWYEALIASIIAMLVEGVDMIYELDDNLILPLVAGMSIILLRLVL